MADKNGGKIKQYRKPINLNLGMIVFGVIFVYIVIGVFMYFTTDHIRPYEVQTGSLAVSNIYKGIALRTEEVVTATDSGYANYYARESSRAGCGDLIYSVDETGKIAEMINSADAGTDNTMSDADLNELKTEITGFTHTFSEDRFNLVYDFKYNVQGTVLKLANYNILENINDMEGAGGFVTFGNAPKSGIVVYSTDGYENTQPADITQADFDMSKYDKKQLISNELVSAGDPVYKLALKEDWCIVIPVEEERLTELVAEEYVKVKFLKNQQTSWASVTALHNEDGTYARLDFTNSMITYCTDRYVDIELITNDDTGLKIPNSAIVEKEFFLIPSAYITKGGANDSYGVLRQSYTEDGTAATEFVQTGIYNKTDEEYYLDDSSLRIGDHLVMPNSTETYPVSKRGTLIGVYNINKGYADFKQVIILYQNDKYSIVQSGTEYGLNAYDHIVLDASTVAEDQLIYE